MKFRWLFTFNAVVAAIYGIPAVLVPGVLYSFYGLDSTAGAQLVMQLTKTNVYANDACCALLQQTVGKTPRGLTDV